MNCIKNIAVLIFSMTFIFGCNYLDIVPDNVATIDFAFRQRTQAKKYLYTCYSYLPKLGNRGINPSLLSGDEIWHFYPYKAFTNPIPDNWEIARGNQSKVNPYLDYWGGTGSGIPLFQGIRDCNTFLENIQDVPDMEDYEKKRWIAEATFLKAYYNWFLLRMYGPIPIIDKNLPVSSNPEEVNFYRQPVDSCFNYIVSLIDSTLDHLPNRIDNSLTELGRITKPIALAIKARILVTAASPLFNGNSDFKDLVDNRGIHLFDDKYDPDKWVEAKLACKEAVEECIAEGYKLYTFQGEVGEFMNSEIQTQMDIRGAVTQKWNSEIIWGMTNSLVASVQRYAVPKLDPTLAYNGLSIPHGKYAPTMRIAEMFYTDNGLPIEEDKAWDYNNRYEVDTATEKERYLIVPNYVTAKLNFNREPRFYADLGFDGGYWYGQGNYNVDNMWHIEGKVGQYSGKVRSSDYSVTGYYCKKLVQYHGISEPPSGTFTWQDYPFPVFRLADLYLLYAETINEVDGPSSEALNYINEVRSRASIPSVQDSWELYSNNPEKYKTKDGFREIIHQERLIELAFEGGRFWDLLRWKDAEKVMNQPIKGWDVDQSRTAAYYQVKVLFQRNFKKRDYFWPIREDDIIRNDNLVQNIGW